MTCIAKFDKVAPMVLRNFIMENTATEIRFIGEALFGTHWIVGFQELTDYPRSTIQSWNERDNLILDAKPGLLTLVENAIEMFTNFLNRKSYDSTDNENVAKVLGDALFHKRWARQFMAMFNADPEVYSISRYRSGVLINGTASFNEQEIEIFTQAIKERLTTLHLIKSYLDPSSNLIQYRIHTFMQTEEFKSLHSTPLQPNEFYVIEPYFCFDKYQNKIYDAEIRVISENKFGRAIELGANAERISEFKLKIQEVYDPTVLEALSNYKSDKNIDQYIVYSNDFIAANKLALDSFKTL